MQTAGGIRDTKAKSKAGTAESQLVEEECNSYSPPLIETAQHQKLKKVILLKKPLIPLFFSSPGYFNSINVAGALLS